MKMYKNIESKFKNCFILMYNSWQYITINLKKYKSVRYYDDFIGLGRKCDTAYIIKYLCYNNLKSYQSNFFNYSYINLTSLPESLENIDSVFSGKLNANYSGAGKLYGFTCELTGHRIHSTMSYNKNDEGNNVDILEEKAKQEFLSKINYLREKFKISLASKKRKLILINIYLDDNILNDINNYIIKLHKSLNKVTQNFDLLVIIEDKYKEKDIKKIKNVFVRYVTHFPLWTETINFNKMDLNGLHSIFSEFRSRTK